LVNENKLCPSILENPPDPFIDILVITFSENDIFGQLLMKNTPPFLQSKNKLDIFNLVTFIILVFSRLNNPPKIFVSFDSVSLKETLRSEILSVLIKNDSINIFEIRAVNFEEKVENVEFSKEIKKGH
jgi:hypothetical protein